MVQYLCGSGPAGVHYRPLVLIPLWLSWSLLCLLHICLPTQEYCTLGTSILIHYNQVDKTARQYSSFSLTQAVSEATSQHFWTSFIHTPLQSSVLTLFWHFWVAVTTTAFLLTILLRVWLYDRVGFDLINDILMSIYQINWSFTRICWCRWHLEETLERGASVACVFFFNPSKAFDSLPYPLILKSLVWLSVCNQLLVRVRDYLSNHCQRVAKVIVPQLSMSYQGSCRVQCSSLCSSSLQWTPWLALPLTGQQTNLYADHIRYYQPLLINEDCAGVQHDVTTISNWISEKS